MQLCVDLAFEQKSSLTARYDILEKSFHNLLFFLFALKIACSPSSQQYVWDKQYSL